MREWGIWDGITSVNVGVEDIGWTNFSQRESGENVGLINFSQRESGKYRLD